MKLIDLTIPLNSQTPIYPGDPRVEILQKATIEKDQFVMHSLSLGSHTGTHIDAPMHMLEQGKPLSSFPLETFFGKGVCIDVSTEYTVEAVKKIEVAKGDIVLLYTGWEKQIGRPEYYEKFPPIPEAVCAHLISKKIKMVGTDSPSADDVPFTSHKLLLQHDILIIESLLHIEELVGKQFEVFAFPLHVEIDGSPIRVIANVL